MKFIDYIKTKWLKRKSMSDFEYALMRSTNQSMQFFTQQRKQIIPIKVKVNNLDREKFGDHFIACRVFDLVKPHIQYSTNYLTNEVTAEIDIVIETRNADADTPTKL